MRYTGYNNPAFRLFEDIHAQGQPFDKIVFIICGIRPDGGGRTGNACPQKTEENDQEQLYSIITALIMPKFKKFEITSYTIYNL